MSHHHSSIPYAHPAPHRRPSSISWYIPMYVTSGRATLSWCTPLLVSESNKSKSSPPTLGEEVIKVKVASLQKNKRKKGKVAAPPKKKRKKEKQPTRQKRKGKKGKVDLLQYYESKKGKVSPVGLNLLLTLKVTFTFSYPWFCPQKLPPGIL